MVHLGIANELYCPIHDVAARIRILIPLRVKVYGTFPRYFDVDQGLIEESQGNPTAKCREIVCQRFLEQKTWSLDPASLEPREKFDQQFQQGFREEYISSRKCAVCSHIQSAL